MCPRTIFVAVHAVEHEPQPLLMRLKVLGELLEVQQPIVIDVTLQDYLWRGGAEEGASVPQRVCDSVDGGNGWIRDGHGATDEGVFGREEAVQGWADGRTNTEVTRTECKGNCAPWKHQEVNRILPDCKYTLSSLHEDRERKREKEYNTIFSAQTL